MNHNHRPNGHGSPCRQPKQSKNQHGTQLEELASPAVIRRCRDSSLQCGEPFDNPSVTRKIRKIKQLK